MMMDATAVRNGIVWLGVTTVASGVGRLLPDEAWAYGVIGALVSLVGLFAYFTFRRYT